MKWEVARTELEKPKDFDLNTSGSSHGKEELDFSDNYVEADKCIQYQNFLRK
jgi:hypothetical protein